MEDVLITLIHPGDTSDNDLKTSVYASIEPVGRDEFQAAGVNGMKAVVAPGYSLVWYNDHRFPKR